MIRLIVYGDIHGCYEEFKQLRNSLNINNSDIEVCVGDFITRGNDSIKTLNYIRSQSILSVLGNHEEKIIRFIKHQKTKKDNPVKLNSDEENIVNELVQDEISFLEKLPIYYKFGNITILHGGLQNHMVLSNLSKDDKQRILRLRYLDLDQKFIAFGNEDNDSKLWADYYDGSQGFVVYGHQTFKEINKSNHALGIDTGCVYGDKLSAAVFTDINNTDKFSIYSVDKH